MWTMADLQNLLVFFVATLTSLLAIVNPLMAAPVFFTLTDGSSADERNALAWRASKYALTILVVFFASGSLILNFFQISIDALRIGGGLMILSSAYGMLQKRERLDPGEKLEAQTKARTNEDIAFSPLAMPLLSGPGAIAVIIGMTADAGLSVPKLGVILLAIALVCLGSYWTLRLSDTIMQRIDTTMVKSFTRIMGFLLLCVGVQFVVNGITPILKGILVP